MAKVLPFLATKGPRRLPLDGAVFLRWVCRQELNHGRWLAAFHSRRLCHRLSYEQVLERRAKARERLEATAREQGR